MYYFAYGSSMEVGQMRRLCGWHCHVLGRAALKNFEIGIDKRGYFNLRPKKGDKVHGMLYDIDQEGMAILDKFEGFPAVFDRKEVSVRDEDNQTYQTWVYLEPAEQFGGDYVSPKHLQQVIAAAEENKLPAEWLAKLRGFADQ
jgi:gamma-glutamylcyclotransferase (GGCT)/AIG2-like uncharacterized protein YtfP